MNKFGNDAATGGYELDDIINLSDYPLHKRNSYAYKEIINLAKKNIEDTSCSVSKGFIKKSATKQMLNETLDLQDKFIVREFTHNIYYKNISDAHQKDDPASIIQIRKNGFLRPDHISRATMVWGLFQMPEIIQFIADCLGYEKLYQYYDPYTSMGINYQEEGWNFPWHFDSSEFAISTLLQKSTGGGIFQWTDEIKSEPSEQMKVLETNTHRVKSLDLEPGDFQIFKGLTSLHRVVPPEGSIPRINLLLGYTPKQKQLAPSEFIKNFWGELHPAHIERDSKNGKLS